VKQLYRKCGILNVSRPPQPFAAIILLYYSLTLQGRPVQHNVEGRGNTTVVWIESAIIVFEQSKGITVLDTVTLKMSVIGIETHMKKIMPFMYSYTIFNKHKILQKNMPLLIAHNDLRHVFIIHAQDAP
jgi:hypothetical protein